MYIYPLTLVADLPHYHEQVNLTFPSGYSQCIVNVRTIDVPDGNPSTAANVAWLIWPVGLAGYSEGYFNQRLEVADFINSDGTCNSCINPYQDSTACTEDTKYQGTCPGAKYWANVCGKDTWDSIKNGKACSVVNNYGKS